MSINFGGKLERKGFTAIMILPPAFLADVS